MKETSDKIRVAAYKLTAISAPTKNGQLADIFLSLSETCM